MNNKIMHDPFPPGQLIKGALQVDFDFKCIDCTKPFTVRSGHAKRCAPCKKEHRKKYHKAYYKRTGK